MRTEEAGSTALGIVTSGFGLTRPRDLRSICTAIEKITKNTHVHPHGALRGFDERSR